MSLRVDSVCASYGRIQVLWKASLHVQKGEIISLIGSNGAGKSTLLRCIMGLVKTQSGEITFENKSLSKLNVHSRVRNGISYVPEGRRLFTMMSVEENLLMGTPRGSRNVEDLFGQVHRLFPILKERGKQLAGNLSGGEQQMLAIGRALMAKPKLMVLDELSSGLAPVMFDRVLDSIRQINELGVSILLAEQNSERALEASSRCYVVENGKIVIEGKSGDLIDDPSVQAAYLGMT